MATTVAEALPVLSLSMLGSHDKTTNELVINARVAGMHAIRQRSVGKLTTLSTCKVMEELRSVRVPDMGRGAQSLASSVLGACVGVS